MQFLSIILCTGLFYGLEGKAVDDEREARQNAFNDGTNSYLLLDGSSNPIDVPGINPGNFPSSGFVDGPLNGFMPMGIDGPLALVSQGISGGGQPDSSGMNQIGNSLNFAGQSGASFPNSGFVGAGSNAFQGFTPFSNSPNNFAFNGNPMALSGGLNSGIPGQVSSQLANPGFPGSLLGGLPGSANPGIGINSLQRFGGLTNLNQFPAFGGQAAGGLTPNSGFTGGNNMPFRFMGPNGPSGLSRLQGLMGGNGFPGANQQRLASVGGLGALQSMGGMNGNASPSSDSSSESNGRSNSQRDSKK